MTIVEQEIFPSPSGCHQVRRQVMLQFSLTMLVEKQTEGHGTVTRAGIWNVLTTY